MQFSHVGLSSSIESIVILRKYSLRPEAIFGLLVSLKFAEFCNFSVPNPPHVDFRKCRRATVAFRLDGYERHNEIFLGEDVVNIDRENAAAKFDGVFEKSDDLIVAMVIAGDGAMAGDMPGYRQVECLKHRWNITLGKIVVRFADNRSVGRNHTGHEQVRSSSALDAVVMDTTTAPMEW